MWLPVNLKQNKTGEGSKIAWWNWHVQKQHENYTRGDSCSCATPCVSMGFVLDQNKLAIQMINAPPHPRGSSVSTQFSILSSWVRFWMQDWCRGNGQCHAYGTSCLSALAILKENFHGVDKHTNALMQGQFRYVVASGEAKSSISNNAEDKEIEGIYCSCYQWSTGTHSRVSKSG